MVVDATEAIVNEIKGAFTDVPHPGDDLMLHPQCMDDNDVEEFYGGIHWHDVPGEIIERNNASLCFFSPEAYRFYLPAYLIWVLNNFATSNSFTLDSTIYSLAPEVAPLLILRGLSTRSWKISSGKQLSNS